jgi:anti-sigma28 factor (negative regulator of flagellin synthesis)
LAPNADKENGEATEVTMNITGNSWPINSSEYSQVQRPSNQRPADETQANRAQDSGSSELHKTDSLREAVGRLVESGDVKTRADKPVRESRIESAKQNKSAGAYNNSDVLGKIVDRLLDQWKI